MFASHIVFNTLLYGSALLTVITCISVGMWLHYKGDIGKERLIKKGFLISALISFIASFGYVWKDANKEITPNNHALYEKGEEKAEHNAARSKTNLNKPDAI